MKHAVARIPVLLLCGVCTLVLSIGQVRSVYAQTCSAEIEPNNETTTAMPVNAPGCLSGQVAAGDPDQFVFALDEDGARQRWNIELSGPSDALTRLYVFDATGKQIAEIRADDLARGQELRLPPGDSRLEVNTRDAEQTIAYTIDLYPAHSRAASQEVEPNDTFQTAQRVDPTQPLQASFDPKRDQDIYRFYVSEVADLRSELRLDTAYAGQVDLSLLDDRGNVLQRRARRCAFAARSAPASRRVRSVHPPCRAV